MRQVVGLLQRARRYQVVHFEGETLFQGRDDMTPVFLLMSLEEVSQVFREKDDQFTWGSVGKQLDE